MALEIERKWLCEYTPSRWPASSRVFVIAQTFLKSPDGVYRRVRKRLGTGNNVDFEEYTHTTKHHVEDGVAEEDEEVITRERYDLLLLEEDPERETVNKLRTVFNHAGRTFEFDQFLGPLSGTYLLELEDCRVGEPVDLPPWISVLREVTGDVAYSNWSLALRR